MARTNGAVEAPTALAEWILLLFHALVGLLAQHPALFVDLPRARDAQGIGRDVVGDGGACGRVAVIAHLHGGDQVGVAADEGMVADHRAMFFFARVIYRYAAAAEIYVFPDVRVADIGEVGDLRPLADLGIFHFDKIAQMRMRADFCIGAQVDEGADIRAVLNFRLLAQYIVELYAVSDERVDQLGIGADDAVFSNRGLSAQDRTRQKAGIRPDRDVRPDEYAVGAGDIHPLQKPVRQHPLAGAGIQVEQPEPVVGGEYYVGVCRRKGTGPLAICEKNPHRVRQVIFIAGVFIGD